MQEKGYTLEALGMDNLLSKEIECLARSNGAIWLADDLSQVEMASDRAVAPLESVQFMGAEGTFRTAGEDGFLSTPFSQGAVAIYYGSSAVVAYILPGVEESGMTLTTMEVPAFGDNKVSVFFGNNIGLFTSASLEEQAAAIEFLAFLFEADNNARWAIASGYLPATSDAVASDLWQSHLQENPYIQAAINTLDYGISSPAYSGQTEVTSKLEVAIEEVLVGGKDAQAEMQAIEDLAKEHLGLN